MGGERIGIIAVRVGGIVVAMGLAVGVRRISSRRADDSDYENYL